MPVHAVSFTLKDDRTRPTRYKSLMEQIRLKGDVWEETTSFALVETTESVTELESRLYLNSDFSHLTDLMIVLDVTGRAGVCRGKNDLPTTLRLMMPTVEQKSLP